ncbi:glucose 1-dehydrogenase [Oryzomonas sagensis]|uniref:Glucose 1-dehydrogenase n=1 Tax=Oryzomonas sagensis TaxID=2603857 RepID=A0ABQ6TNZ3_9BACT|nr:glucose 1-dehydrogenase [Oryzomonas sagensis]KAB0670117.1 glucose 1-dehydrogenase [Oryzomonas sagensis]
MTQQTAGRVALVTGGGQGIGKGIAKRLLEEGMAVVIADRDTEAAQETAGEFGPLGDVHAVTLDVADEAAVAGALAQTLSRFGRLDALINNAGHGSSPPGPVELLELSEWNRVLGTNLTGAFLCTKHAVPALRSAGGAIVNIASTRALQSEADTEAYSASKGGLVALTHALAVSLGPHIRVNCVSPGWIAVDDWKKSGRRTAPELRPEDHGQHPAGRVGRPEDIAGMVAYLVSPQAGFVTGQNFIVDGGMTRKMIYVP